MGLTPCRRVLLGQQPIPPPPRGGLPLFPDGNLADLKNITGVHMSDLTPAMSMERDAAAVSPLGQGGS